MAKNSVDLICSVAELTGLFDRSASLTDFLQSVVTTVAYHMRAAVCSIYLYDEEARRLVLRANQGLHPDAVGTLSMKLGEGITGRALKELRPIRAGQASKSRHYKFFPGVQEEQYEAFLAVPILRGNTRIGVLVVQDPEIDYFGENDTKALRAIAAQLATSIESAQLLIDLHATSVRASEEEAPLSEEDSAVLHGRSICGGLAGGTATIIDYRRHGAGLHVPDDALGRTDADFREAVTKAEAYLRSLQDRMEQGYGDISSMIFSAQLLMLRDPSFLEAIEQRMGEGMDPALAIQQIVEQYADLFGKSENPRLREKTYDIQDIGHHLIYHLRSERPEGREYRGEIVVARDLLPSDIVKISAEGAEGLVLVGGGATAHVSVLARSLDMPTVHMANADFLTIAEKTPLFLDGYQGIVYVQPSPDTLRQFERHEATRRQADELAKDVEDETWTADGTRIHLLANINLLSDVDVALRLKAEGVGLYRSEFPFIVRNSFPSEEEQYRIYRKLVDSMEGKSIQMRTLDIGGDKMLSYFPNADEANPFLGLRAIRFSLRNRELFSEQLCAMLRAGAGADIGILFPLVASLDDFQEAQAIVRDCQALLGEQGIPHNASPSLGAMIELPSAVEMIDELAQVADRLCIGTNDLVQYTLGVDRTNDAMADMYVFHHPAVLRVLKRIVDSAHKWKTPVSVCGDMVLDEGLLPFLIGIGVTSLSVGARNIPRIQKVLQTVDSRKAQEDAAEILALGTINEVHAMIGDGGSR